MAATIAAQREAAGKFVGGEAGLAANVAGLVEEARIGHLVD